MRDETFVECSSVCIVPDVIRGRGRARPNRNNEQFQGSRPDKPIHRPQNSVPPDYDVLLGAKTGSDIAGYDNLPVTFAHKDKQTVVNFPISKDGSTLARVEKFSIDDNPALAIDVDKRPVRGAPTVRSSPS
jgi:hypothetical protein